MKPFAYVVMQYPRWQFPLEESQSHGSSGVPLYLGSLPQKSAEQYFAVLPLRPPTEHKVLLFTSGKFFFFFFLKCYVPVWQDLAPLAALLPLHLDQ